MPLANALQRSTSLEEITPERSSAPREGEVRPRRPSIVDPASGREAHRAKRSSSNRWDYWSKVNQVGRREVTPTNKQSPHPHPLSTVKVHFLCFCVVI